MMVFLRKIKYSLPVLMAKVSSISLSVDAPSSGRDVLPSSSFCSNVDQYADGYFGRDKY